MTVQEIRYLCEDIMSQIPIDCENDEVEDIIDEMAAIVYSHLKKCKNVK